MQVMEDEEICVHCGKCLGYCECFCEHGNFVEDCHWCCECHGLPKEDCPDKEEEDIEK